MSLPLFDAHCDTLTTALEAGVALEKNKLHLDLERLGRFAPAAQVFAVWGEPQAPPVLEQALDFFQRCLERAEGRLALCRTPAELQRANAAGQIAAVLSVEGAEQLGCDRTRLASLRAEGVSFVHLCWNSDNSLCGAAMDGGGGLTDSGREFVRACWDLGIAVDLSHASDRSFWDVADLSAKEGRPLLAGHSNCRALCPSPRNLTDEMLDAVITSRGAVGLNLCPDFLGLGRDIPAALAHGAHVLARGGEENLCLGCDLDGIDELPRGIAGVQDLNKLADGLCELGYPDAMIRNVFYCNFLRFWERSFR